MELMLLMALLAYLSAKASGASDREAAGAALAAGATGYAYSVNRQALPQDGSVTLPPPIPLNLLAGAAAGGATATIWSRFTSWVSENAYWFVPALLAGIFLLMRRDQPVVVRGSDQ